ncbi:MAG TPA: PaaI family thioesterase [Xanthomonadales bacterium]|nr:PaaI family thioesterase [Xanthomonadales bacterium]
MDLHAFAHTVFAEQAFSRFIGARLESVGPGTAAIAIDIVPHLLQQHGFVHGGVLSYLADNSITFAGGLAMQGNALTSEFKINYVRPAKGVRIIARATADSVGRRQAVCRCEIVVVREDGEEALCALAQGTVVAAADPT